MAHCLNPRCPAPETPGNGEICQRCQASLLLQGRYRALGRIGSGGFGKTFKAQDEGKPSKPSCVIKQLFYNDAATRQKSIELFEQEAIYLEKLGDHSQIPSLHWQGQQDGIHYIVQEYIDGETLEQELKNSGPFSEEKIWQVLAELVPLLAQLHQVEVIHRDIKPDNIIRRRRDRRLVLVDFGAVKVATQTALAKTGTSIGDAQYAAPEQARGRAVFASDLYGLGTTCLHLMTGQSPWDLYSDSEGRWIWQELLPEGVTVSQRLGSILDQLVAVPLKQRFDRAEAVLEAMHPPAPPPPLRQPQKPTPKPQGRPYQEPQTRQPLPVDPTPGQPLTQAQKGNLAPRGLLGRRAFVGLGVAAFGAVVARSWWQPRSGQMILTERPNVGSCGDLENPLVYGDLVAGLPTETYGFRTVVNLNEGGTGGQEVSREVTRCVEDLGNGVLLYLVRVPAGSFTMGSPDTEVDRDGDEGPQHEVYVPECWMSQFAVTQAQYRAITGQSPSSFEGDQNPVENVNWDDAMAFCEALRQKTGRNYHLPPEAIWEYACRACSTTPFHFGATIRPDLVNYNGNYPYRNAREGLYREQTVPVGSLPPNLWGLHEMHGNVWEWCEDPVTDDYGWRNKNHPSRNNALNILPYGNSGARVLRGGSWNDNARNCRSANRGWGLRDYSDIIRGFRVLLSSRTS